MPDLKVTADHLRRDAYLYVRQSTLRQVAENVKTIERLSFEPAELAEIDRILAV